MQDPVTKRPRWRWSIKHVLFCCKNTQEFLNLLWLTITQTNKHPLFLYLRSTHCRALLGNQLWFPHQSWVYTGEEASETVVVTVRNGPRDVEAHWQWHAALTCQRTQLMFFFLFKQADLGYLCRKSIVWETSPLVMSAWRSIPVLAQIWRKS